MILDDAQARWRAEERRLLQSLALQLAQLDPTREDVGTLQQAIADLDDLFRLVIVGEFNAGKSAVINALLGGTVVEEGVTPTTAVINVLRYGEQPTERMSGDVRERAYPSPLLREISIIDTPGTNAVIRQHQEITEHFVPRSDLVLFVTSADRPFTETERGFLELIRDWGKKIVIVLNKADLIETSAQRAEIERFITDNARRLLGIDPPILLISARQAQRAQAQTDPAERERALEASGFAAFQRFLIDTLDEAGRVQLKLLAPLGVADRLLARYRGVVDDRIGLLEEDFKTVEHIDAQISAYQQDLENEFRPRLAGIENIIHETNDRGIAFFEETIRLGRVFDLFNTAKIKASFEDQVLTGTAERIDEAVNELSDWLMGHELRLWNAVMEYFNRRRQARFDDELIGQSGGGFDYTRRELLQAVSRRAREVVSGFDHQTEAHELASSVREAVTQTAIAEAGAVGLGTAIAVIVGTAAADVTGVLAASVIGGLGLFIIPNRRRRATEDFLKKTEALRERLTAALTDQFHRELDRSRERIADAIGPYRRFVREEYTSLTGLKTDLDASATALRALRMQIEAPGSSPSLTARAG
jgi:small GTP-binding protein